jgi:hypothetical protein
MSSVRKEMQGQSTRLIEFDYIQAGAYFITNVTYMRECFLGKVMGDHVVLSVYGKIAYSEWFNLRVFAKRSSFMMTNS